MTPPHAWLQDLSRTKAPVLGGLVPGAAMAGLAGVARAWIVVPTPDDADRWVRGLKWHGATAVPYPADDVRPWSGDRPSPELAAQRLLARDLWSTDAKVLVVAPARALLQRAPVTVPVQELRRGATLDREALLRRLQSWGWIATPRVEAPGCFAVRGGTLDVWSPLADAPLRVEWFDDEIERLRVLDPSTGAVRAGVEAARLQPVRELVLDEAGAQRALERLKRFARQVDTTRYRRVEADLRSRNPFPGVEDYLACFTEVALPAPGAPLYVVEPELVRAELGRFEEQVRARWEGLPAEERPLILPEERYGRASQVALAGAVAVRHLVMDGAVDFESRDNRELRVSGGQLAPIVKQLRAWRDEGRAVTLVVDGHARAEHVRALLGPHGLNPDEGRASQGRIALEIGDLPEGFQVEDRVVVTSDELFGARRDAAPVRSSTRFREAAAGSLASLKPGDPVVHVKHGIGTFAGLARMPLGAAEGDFVVVRYRDGEKLYVPVTRMDTLSRWQGAPGAEPPRVDKLGGSSFETRRAKVRDAVLALANELLRLHARRQLVEAPALAPGEMCEQFAASFAYPETPDQETAIADVLADLGETSPMDRLLLGDVGFGKTEVALRAAMCAVENGYQVALMCPTTVLAHQHAHGFRERLAEFPVRVVLLTGARDAEARAAVASGAGDIVVGTTSLLARDVRFKKLGLVVVDEEHRFGVKQKEQLKRTAAGAHYLAMSATPIPRSLHMALAGIRGMSVLATPPLGRQPVRTEVGRFDKTRIREEILAELARGGQAYFVHNRVQSIAGVARWLQKLVPEARVGVIHGQLSEAAVERAMLAFVRRETTVLVCTTIVESGIDVPTANTMLVNRADTLGVAQLYQLRGRVGRSNVAARCVLLVSGEGDLRRTAMDRLRAVQEHQELGSNFQLASADLEARGGGELLGDKQHGHIAAIGFDAYLRLLEEAVAQVRGDAAVEEIDPEIDAPVVALLPEDYVPTTAERLDLYQQLANARTREQVQRTLAWIEDRYGTLPREVQDLGWISALRCSCRALGIARVAVLKVRVVVDLAPSHALDPVRLLSLFTSEPARFRRAGDMGLEMRFAPDEANEPLRLVEYALARLREALPEPRK